MLNNEPQSETANSVSMDRRVRPDEFSAAVVAIQKRKAERERLLSDTVAVDDVVRELNIDATPEEILAEVEVQRKAKLAASIPPPPVIPRPSIANVPLMPVSRTDEREERRRMKEQGWYRRPGRGRSVFGTVMSIGMAFWVLSMIFGHSNINMSDLHIGSIQTPALLSTLGPGQKAAITNGELNALINGESPSKINITVGGSLEDWTIVRMDGKFYLEAYAEDTLPTSGKYTIYNDINDDPIVDGDYTFPISSLTGDKVKGQGVHGSIDVNNIVTDSHLRDDWDDE
jgi:hypothetical protein